MRNYPYLMNRNGHYYFRIAVPSSLMPSWGKKELLCSLRTKDLSEARVRCLIVLGAAQGLFQASLSGQVVMLDCLRECLNQFQNKPVPGKLSPSLTSINKRGMGIEGDTPISEIFELYLAECGADRQKTLLTKRAMLKVWLEVMGDNLWFYEKHGNKQRVSINLFNSTDETVSWIILGFSPNSCGLAHTKPWDMLFRVDFPPLPPNKNEIIIWEMPEGSRISEGCLDILGAGLK